MLTCSKEGLYSLYRAGSLDEDNLPAGCSRERILKFIFFKEFDEQKLSIGDNKFVESFVYYANGDEWAGSYIKVNKSTFIEECDEKTPSDLLEDCKVNVANFREHKASRTYDIGKYYDNNKAPDSIKE